MYTSKFLGKATIIITIVVAIIAGLLKFNLAGQIIIVLMFFWDIAFRLYYYQATDESTWDISYDKRQEIKYSVVDKRLETAIEKYDEAMRQYNLDDLVR